MVSRSLTQKLRDANAEVRTLRNLGVSNAETNEQLRGYLEIAYSEMAFAVGTISSRREQDYDYRSKRLAEFCDELRSFLDGKALPKGNTKHE